MRPEKFEFGRSRGIVWVADLVGSSRHINNKESVDSFEEFIPRLHWVSSLVVEAAGGQFIKWTGDGFLAWFDTPLHREIGRKASNLFEAIWHLTVLINVTQLGVKSPRKFKIRHGVTYEQDALITRMVYPGGFELLDLTGRAVVLAFRLSGIPVDFPGIVTEKSLVDASREWTRDSIAFARWNPSAEERGQYFKGESWGTRSIYASTFRKPTRGGPKTAFKMAREAIDKAKGKEEDGDIRSTFEYRLNEAMASGPPWCGEVLEKYVRFVRDNLLGTLKKALPDLEKNASVDGRKK